MDLEEYERYATQRAREDAFMQELLGQLRAAEAAYLRIRDSLPPEERDALERYIALCEEIEHRRGVLAAECID